MRVAYPLILHLRDGKRLWGAMGEWLRSPEGCRGGPAARKALANAVESPVPGVADALNRGLGLRPCSGGIGSFVSGGAQADAASSLSLRRISTSHPSAG